MKISMEQEKAAVAWGECLANCVRQRFGNDLNALLHTMRIRLLAVPQDQPEFPRPRLAVWEGDTRTIRLFIRPLREKFSDWDFAARRACTHELFHALSADRYRFILPPASPPVLSPQNEECAAEAFSHSMARNFCLTLEGRVLNF